MARTTKYSEAIAQRICDALRSGNTRKAAAVYGGISQDSFGRWLKRFADFADAIARAEAECQVRNVLIVQKAAAPHDAGHKSRTVKTVIKTRKTRHPDGTVVEEPVALQEVTETEITKQEFDWHAASWILERRFGKEWREQKSIDIGKLPNEKLLELLDELDEGEDPDAPEAGGEA